MTRNLIVTTCVVACLSALPALAQDNAGKQQLANQLGVSAEDYSMMQLVQLKCRLEAAHSEGERARLLEGVASYGEMPAEMAEASNEQIAAELGVDAGDYSTEQLSWLRNVVEANDCTVEEAQELLAQGESIGTGAAGAKAQLAAELGVDPQQHTLVQMVQMKFEGENEETN